MDAGMVSPGVTEGVVPEVPDAGQNFCGNVSIYGCFPLIVGRRNKSSRHGQTDNL